MSAASAGISSSRYVTFPSPPHIPVSPLVHSDWFMCPDSSGKQRIAAVSQPNGRTGYACKLDLSVFYSTYRKSGGTIDWIPEVILHQECVFIFKIFICQSLILVDLT